MKEQVVLLIDSAEEGAPLLEQVSRLGQDGDFHVYLCPEGQEGIACLQDLISVSLEPAVIVVGPHAKQPLATARQLHPHAPMAHLIFMVEEDRIDALRREMSIAPVRGTHWIVAPENLPQLNRLIHESSRSALQRDHLRSTLDKMDPELSSSLLSDTGTYRRLGVSDRYLFSVLAHAYDAVISMDENGAITTWNVGAERIFGLSEHEARGQQFGSLLHKEGDDLLDQWIRCIEAGEAVAGREVRFLRADQSVAEVELTLAPIIDESGHRIGISAIGRDIGQRKLIERDRSEELHQEQTARLEAEETSRLKDEFLATLSHELRTPLNSILGWIHILRTGQLDPESTARALEIIERNTKEQAQLIQNLIDITELTTGKVQLQHEAVQLTSVIDQALETIRPVAESKSIGLEVQVNGLVEPVWGDAERLRQMMDNLLSNAVKFTPAGGKIKTALRQIGSQAEIRITDTGIGIQAEFLPHLFNHFRQTESSITRAFGGLGLGLSMVRHLAELHGGTASAESAGEGAGTAFVVLLPLNSARSAEAAKKAASDKVLIGVRVLVADDEAETRTVLTTLLEQAGATVSAAATSKEALDSIVQSVPDIVLLDIAMPYEDGYVLLEKIRSHPGFGEIPAIALTGYTGQEDRRKALAAGFHVHLTKPVDPSRLIKTLSAAVRPRRSEPDQSAPSVGLKA